jgi:hypothetical protein
MFSLSKKKINLEKTQKTLESLQIGKDGPQTRVAEAEETKNPKQRTPRGRYDFSPETASWLLEEVFKKSSPEKDTLTGLSDVLRALVRNNEPRAEEKDDPNQEEI